MTAKTSNTIDDIPVPIRSEINISFLFIRSAITPIKGAVIVPENRRAPSNPTKNGESVATKMYHPRIRVSISDPQVFIASADHWNLKLLIRNADRTDLGPDALLSEEFPLDLLDLSATIDS